MQAVHALSASIRRRLLALGRAGLLREGDEFIHCTHLNDEAWQMIKDTGGRISLCPPLEMAMGHGMPAIQDALDHGIRPSLSSDHGTTVAQDMFTVMRAAFNVQRLRSCSATRRSEPNLPPLLTCREVLEFATIAGARCANLDHKVGTLTPGKEADILMLRADRLDVWPLNNAPSTVVNLHEPEPRRGGVHRRQGEEMARQPRRRRQARVLRLAQEARAGVMRRANFAVDVVG